MIIPLPLHSIIVPIVITFLIVIFAVGGDKLVTKVDHHVLKAIIDNATHGFIGIFSWAVVVFSLNSIRNLKLNHCAEIMGCGVIASLIDLDHFIAARSLSLQVKLSVMFLILGTLLFSFKLIFFFFRMHYN